MVASKGGILFSHRRLPDLVGRRGVRMGLERSIQAVPIEMLVLILHYTLLLYRGGCLYVPARWVQVFVGCKSLSPLDSAVHVQRVSDPSASTIGK